MLRKKHPKAFEERSGLLNPSLTPVHYLPITPQIKLTFVPPQPSLKAASCANSSPNPSIKPLINGRSRLIAAPRNKPHKVGGEYNIIGELEEEDGGEGESSSLPEYCSESDGIVMDDSVSGMPSEAIMGSMNLGERTMINTPEQLPNVSVETIYLSWRHCVDGLCEYFRVYPRKYVMPRA
jgi:hypothetical protein